MSDRRRNLLVFLLVFGLIAASVVAVISQPTKLGLDLQGGVQLVYQGEDTPQQKVNTESLDRAKDIMEKRVNQLGVAEPSLSIVGDDQIEVNLPAVKDAQRAKEQVGNTAQMFFYDFERNVLDSDCKTNANQVQARQDLVNGLYQAVEQASKCPAFVSPSNTRDKATYYAFNKKTKEPLNQGIPSTNRQELLDSLSADERKDAKIFKVKRGILVLRDADSDVEGREADLWWILRDEQELSGTDIKDPQQDFDGRTNQPNVSFNFSKNGREQFRKITKRIAERGRDNAFAVPPNQASHHFAIRLDNELISIPQINFQDNPQGIGGRGGAQITGNFTVQSAQDLATLLKLGALPIELKLVSDSQVSATLGKQALEEGLVAAIAGFIIVAIFLIVFYRVLGVIATGAMIIYGLYFFALIKLVPIVLTLPGIAGLILTIGVAADANIVIFERVKEEVRAGHSISASITNGYKKGLTTIIDANVVTLLTAFVLFVLATSGVKGFAFVLGIGTIVSLFTAVLVTHTILSSMRNSRLLRRPSALGAGRQRARWHWDFVGASKWFFSMSGAILLVGGFAVATKSLNFGIDFLSGTRIQAPLEKQASVADVRKVLAPLGEGNAEIQRITNKELGENVILISTKTLEPDQVENVNSALKKNFGFAAQAEVKAVGPSFGATVAKSALLAIIASLIVISIYIGFRFQWKFAVPVLIALTHDILITSGVYSLTGREVTISTVAALLTILGYSLYDTIIVFDRIRENIPRMPSAAFSQIVNRSMSEVLTRSLATSFSTLLPVFALLFYGGDTLKDFAFALIVGIISGAYSSIFIAAPVLTHWKEREGIYRTRERRIRDELGFVPAFAVPLGSAPIDVAPMQKPGKAGKTITAPQDPTNVSGTEFDEMVKDLGIEEKPARGPKRPRGGRRARGGDASSSPGGAKPSDTPPKDGPAQSGSSSTGDTAEDQGKSDKPKKPRKRRHGRPR